MHEVTITVLENPKVRTDYTTDLLVDVQHIGVARIHYAGKLDRCSIIQLAALAKAALDIFSLTGVLVYNGNGKMLLIQNTDLVHHKSCDVDNVSAGVYGELLNKIAVRAVTYTATTKMEPG